MKSAPPLNTLLITLMLGTALHEGVQQLSEPEAEPQRLQEVPGTRKSQGFTFHERRAEVRSPEPQRSGGQSDRERQRERSHVRLPQSALVAGAQFALAPARQPFVPAALPAEQRHAGGGGDHPGHHARQRGGLTNVLERRA